MSLKPMGSLTWLLDVRYKTTGLLAKCAYKVIILKFASAYYGLSIAIYISLRCRTFI